VFGKVVEGFNTLESINEVSGDDEGRSARDIRIFNPLVLEDPYLDWRINFGVAEDLSLQATAERRLVLSGSRRSLSRLLQA